MAGLSSSGKGSDMAQAVATCPSVPQVIDQGDDFGLHDLRIFDHIPDHRDYGIVALRGLVVIYDVKPLHTEGVIEGAFYVREHQYPRACRPWQDWLRSEWDERDRRAGPYSPLVITREVVRAIRWPRPGETNNWAARLASGFIDGPYYDWCFGHNFVGKVVGIYRP